MLIHKIKQTLCLHEWLWPVKVCSPYGDQGVYMSWTGCEQVCRKCDKSRRVFNPDRYVKVFTDEDNVEYVIKKAG